MDTLVAMFFTLGLIGQPADKAAAEQPVQEAAPTAQTIPQPVVEPAEDRRQRIMVTNQWLRELRGGQVHTPSPVALRNTPPNS